MHYGHSLVAAERCTWVTCPDSTWCKSFSGLHSRLAQLNPLRFSGDWVVRYGNRFFQLQRQSTHYAPAKSKVVCEGRHGSIAIEYRGRALPWQEIPVPARPKGQETKSAVKRAAKPSLPRAKWVPSANPPLLQAARREVEQRARPGSGRAPAATRPSLALPCASP